jgi:nucleoside-diphosphate-sugar epimerase
VLDLTAALGAKRFIFSSSLAACNFPDDGQSITEESAPDAEFPYARSKREAEKLIRERPGSFDRTILRLAAIYSDWCEYPPVYAFLTTWLSSAWNARMLGGRGASAVPYLHIRDLTALLLRVIERSDELPKLCTYNASPSSATSHLELYRASTKFLYGQERSAYHIPAILARPAVAVRQLIMDACGYPPFERIWMMRYIDRELRVDASRTQADLGWEPTPRYNIRRRLLILIENMKSHPEIWRQRNEAAFLHVARRPNFVMYSNLRRNRDQIISEVADTIRYNQRQQGYHEYERMTDTTLSAYVSLFFDVLVTAMRTRDRTPVRSYARTLAHQRQRQGFALEHVCMAIEAFRQVMHAHLSRAADPIVTSDEINEYVDLSLQLALDELEEIYSQHGAKGHAQAEEIENVNLHSANLEMIRLVEELHDICPDGWEIGSRFTDLQPDVEERTK